MRGLCDTIKISNLSNYIANRFSQMWWWGNRYPLREFLVFSIKNSLKKSSATATTAAVATTTATTIQRYSIFGPKMVLEQLSVTAIPNPHHHPTIQIPLLLKNFYQPCGTHHCIAHAY